MYDFYFFPWFLVDCVTEELVHFLKAAQFVEDNSVLTVLVSVALGYGPSFNCY